MFVGIAGTVYKTEADFTLMPGGSYDFHGYTFKYSHYDIQKDDHRIAMRAFVDVIEASQKIKTMQPAKNFYFSSEQPTTEVNIYQTVLRDLYLVIGNMDEKTGRADFKVTINPLISFLWLGGIILLLGTVLVLMPRGFKRRSIKNLTAVGIVVLLNFFLLNPREAHAQMQSAGPESHVVQPDAEVISNAPEGDPRKDRMKTVAEKLICQCGGCVRESLRSCACDFAASERKRLYEMIDAGQSDDAIVDSFISQYGLQVLSQPPEEGFFNIGYWMPGIILLLSIMAAGFVVKKRRRRVNQGDDQPNKESDGGAALRNNPDAQKLVKELEDF